MRLTWLALAIWLPLAAANVEYYDEETVMKFVNSSALLPGIAEECSSSLSRVWAYLNDFETLDFQRVYFHESFGTGPRRIFTSRDQDRWVYRGYECLLSAGETIYSQSEHPMHYCYGYNEEDKDAQAFAVCLPSTCAGDYDKLLHAWQKVVKPQGEVKPFDTHGCTRSRYEKQWFEQFVPVADFAFNMLLVAFVGMATVFHKQRGDDVKSLSAQILLAFSLTRNLKRLTALPKDPQATITCMFGIRFLSMVWTLIGHSFIFIQSFIENVEDYKDDMIDSFGNQWINNFTLSVDSFLVLGGTVLSYSWFRKWLKNTTEPEPTWRSWGYWLRFYRHRIVRLWPAYLYTLMAVTLRISKTHFHPNWPGTDPAVQCPKYWWQNALFINSVLDNQCMPWTWYIGTEFIYYLISPIFLLSLRKSPQLGLAIAVATIAASAGLNTVSIMANNFPPTQFLWKQPDMFNMDFIQHHLELYIKPQFRIGPYVLGILLGYYLACFQRNGRPARSTTHVVVGWLMCVALGFWGLYGLYPALQGWDWPVYHLVYGSIHRDVFALALCWLIYACHTGIGGPVNYALSMNWLIPLSNLCYTGYLFHMIAVVCTFLLTPFPIQYTSKFGIFVHCFIQLIISYAFAFFATMVVELPALNIEHLLLHTPKPKASLKPVPTTDSEMQLKPPTPPPEEQNA